MSTPDIVLIDTEKLRCEIKGGKPLINGKRPLYAFVRLRMLPARGTFLCPLGNNGREWCGCLLGSLVSIVDGGPQKATEEYDKLKKAAYARLMAGDKMAGRYNYHEASAEIIGAPVGLLRRMESGFEGYYDKDTDEPECLFGVLVADDVEDAMMSDEDEDEDEDWDEDEDEED